MKPVEAGLLESVKYPQGEAGYKAGPSLLKEVARLHGDLDGLVTANVARAIQAKLAREK